MSKCKYILSRTSCPGKMINLIITYNLWMLLGESTSITVLLLTWQLCLCWCVFSSQHLLNLQPRESFERLFMYRSFPMAPEWRTHTKHLYFLEGNAGLTLRLFSFITAELLICRVTSLQLQPHFTSLLCLAFFCFLLVVYADIIFF